MGDNFTTPLWAKVVVGAALLGLLGFAYMIAVPAETKEPEHG